jgi:predicted RNase H-like HicB family nuclease
MALATGGTDMSSEKFCVKGKGSESIEKPFVVVSGDLKLRFIPDSGGFAVIGVNPRGLNTQGDTFEEALANAHDAAKCLAESRAIMARERKEGSLRCAVRPSSNARKLAEA